MLAAVINFCSNDYRYLELCIRGVRNVAHQILICVCDHFFDGSPENFSLLEKCFTDHPSCTFLEFAYLPNQIYGSRDFSSMTERQRIRQWHNTGRLIGYFYLDERIKNVLFLDADEIADPLLFTQWYQSLGSQPETALRFASYWYFREARIRGREMRDSALLVRRENLNADLFFDENERKGLFAALPGPKKKGVLNQEGKPMFHHFSWVKTMEEMLLKVRTWGHKTDLENWEGRIIEEFSHPFDGTDFSGDTDYLETTPLFDPLTIAVPRCAPQSLGDHMKRLSLFENVHRIEPREIFEKDLKEKFY